MESQKESLVKYDDRRKELVHITRENKETDFGEISLESKGTYKEEGIRKVLANLQLKKKAVEKNIEILSRLQEPKPELTPELQKLKEQLITLQKIDHDEKIGADERKKEEDDLRKNEEDLKQVNEDIRKIRDAIGTRLNL